MKLWPFIPHFLRNSSVAELYTCTNSFLKLASFRSRRRRQDIFAFDIDRAKYDKSCSFMPVFIKWIAFSLQKFRWISTSSVNGLIVRSVSYGTSRRNSRQYHLIRIYFNTSFCGHVSNSLISIEILFAYNMFVALQINVVRISGNMVNECCGFTYTSAMNLWHCQ